MSNAIRFIAKILRKHPKQLPGRTIQMSQAEAQASLAAMFASQRTERQW